MDLKESLDRETSGLKQIVVERFGTQPSRLDRQAGLMQTGNRWISRLNDWSEKIDAAMESMDREIAELKERVTRLEHPPQ